MNENKKYFVDGKSFFIVSVFLFSLFSNCSGFVEIKEPKSLNPYQTGPNVLVATQTRLAIPERWVFKKPEKASSSQGNVDVVKLFQFNDRSNNIFGKFVYNNYSKALSSSLDPDSLARIFAKKMTPNFVRKSLYRTTIDNKKSHIMTGTHKDKRWDAFIALIAEGKAFNEIQLLSDEGYLFSNSEIAYKIFKSYAFKKKGLSERKNKGWINFKCADGNWRWHNDWYGNTLSGYLVVANKTDYTLLSGIGVARTDIESTKEVEGLYKGEIVVKSEFNVSLSIGDVENIQGKGIATKNEDNLISVYYCIKYKKRRYLIEVLYKEYRMGTTKPEHVHLNLPELINFFSKYLYFSDN